MKGAGGTSGGIGVFLGGAAMVLTGGYLLLTRVSVVSGGWRFYGYDAFGLSLSCMFEKSVSFNRDAPGRVGPSSRRWGLWARCASD